MAQYYLTAWVRGKIDPDDSAGGWIVRAALYDAGGIYLNTYQNAASGNDSTISETWQQRGGVITIPASAMKMRIQLYNYMNTGWVAYDDVLLTGGEEGEEIVIQRVTYSLGGQAIAVRVTGDPVAANNGLFYLHSDHLGSVSAMSYGFDPDGSGPLTTGDLVPTSTARYTPFGDWRTEPGTNPAITDRGYTGHKSNNSGANDLGLIYMNARY